MYAQGQQILYATLIEVWILSFVWLQVNRLLNEAGGKISDIEIPLEPGYIFIGQVEPIQLQEGMTLKPMQA